MNPNQFFGLVLNPESLHAQAFVLFLAVLLGGLIGLERERHGNPAGMRTHILVCVGSAIITLTSVAIGIEVRGGVRGDPGHIAAQIVSGVGFLGAGAIMREGVTVRGLTSAASIWATAGIGIALGASPHLGELAVIASAVVLVTLGLLEPLERRLKLKQGGQLLEIDVLEADRGPVRVLDILSSLGISVLGVRCEAPTTGPNPAGGHASGPTRHMEIRANLPSTIDRAQLSTRLLNEPGVLTYHLQ